MGIQSLTDWLKDAETVAWRISPAKFHGICGKKLLIPERVIAYLPGPGNAKTIAAGREITAPTELVLLKEREIELLYTVSLKSKEAFPLTLTLALVLYVDTDIRSLKEFALELLTQEEILDRGALMRRFQATLDDVLSQYVALSPVEQLYATDAAREIAKMVRSGLKRLLFKYGLDLMEIRGLTLHCPDYEALREKQRLTQIADEEARIEAHQARARQQLREIWERDQKGQALAEHEVEEFYRALAKEGYLKDLERRKAIALEEKELEMLKAQYAREKSEHQAALTHALEKVELERKLQLDRMRLEHDLENTRRIAEALQGADIEVLISQITDEPMRADLYRMLLEREMTPEQIKARAATDFTPVNQRLDAIYEKLLDIVEKAPVDVARRATPETHREDDRPHRVLVCAAKTVHAYDPYHRERQNHAAARYDFDGYALGGIRSIRVVERHGVPKLAVGAMRGVYLTNFQDNVVLELAFPWGPRSKGGTNAVALADNRLFATHGEHGLVYWDLAEDAPRAQKIQPALIRGQATTRSVTVADGLLFFASGQEVYALEMTDLQQSARHYRGSRAVITALAQINDRIYAGNMDGEILSWALDDPACPRRELKKANPIYMLRTAVLGGIEHLIIGCRETGVIARLMTGHLETFYSSEYPIRWADAAGDIVAGVDRSGHNLLLWQADRPAAPLARIYLPDEITDLAIETCRHVT